VTHLILGHCQERRKKHHLVALIRRSPRHHLYDSASQGLQQGGHQILSGNTSTGRHRQRHRW
jgi:hypothetical protein